MLKLKDACLKFKPELHLRARIGSDEVVALVKNGRQRYGKVGQ